MGLLAGSIWLSGCDSNPPLYATLTLKRDGTHFAGPVVRREPSSITVTSASGETRVFLYSELSDITYGAPASEDSAGPAAQKSSTPAKPSGNGNKAAAPVSPSAAAAAASIPATGVVLPAGTEVGIRTRSFLDSCCIPPDGIELGLVESDVKGSNGKVVLPEGANVTMMLANEEVVDGRLEMTFELGTADFGDRHYLLTSTKGTLTPGLRTTLSGAKDKSPEAKLNGVNVHISNNSYLSYKAATPVEVKPSE